MKRSEPWAIWCLWGWLAQVYLAFMLPEVADEAYYARWGEALRWGYFDHPPAIAWWSWGGGRWLNLTLLPVAWYLFAQAARTLGARVSPLLFIAAVWWTPLGLSSGVISTPDAPLLLGWSIAVWGYAHQRAVFSALGVALGAWAKAMIWPATLGLAWLWYTDQRAPQSTRWRRSALWTLLSLALYIPHLWWSYLNGGSPWSFQGSRAWGQISTFEWLAGQILVGGGLWSISLACVYSQELKRRLWRTSSAELKYKIKSVSTSTPEIGPSQIPLERVRIWWWLSIPSALTWLILSVVVRVEANWSALAWPMGIIWVLDGLSSQQAQRHLRWGLLFTLPCLTLPLVHQVIPLGWGPPRDGKGLTQCLESSLEKSQVDLLWVAGRYQEAALLGLPLAPRSKNLERGVRVNASPSTSRLIYQRAWDRRESQYDQEIAWRSDIAEPIPCDAAYLGPSSWLGPRCRGHLSPLDEAVAQCRIQVTLCLCTSASSAHPKHAKKGNRTLTP